MMLSSLHQYVVDMESTGIMCSSIDLYRQWVYWLGYTQHSDLYQVLEGEILNTNNSLYAFTDLMHKSHHIAQVPLHSIPNIIDKRYAVYFLRYGFEYDISQEHTIGAKKYINDMKAYLKPIIEVHS